MYVNVAVLKETREDERRVALVPAVTARLIKLGARLHMEAGAGLGARLPDSAYADVAIMTDRLAMVADADVVLAVQPPDVTVLLAMKPSAILICFVYAEKEAALVDALIERRITCFAMERVPRSALALNVGPKLGADPSEFSCGERLETRPPPLLPEP